MNNLKRNIFCFILLEYYGYNFKGSVCVIFSDPQYANLYLNNKKEDIFSFFQAVFFTILFLNFIFFTIFFKYSDEKIKHFYISCSSFYSSLYIFKPYIG